MREDAIIAVQSTFEDELENGQSIAIVPHSAAGIFGTIAINNVLAKNPEAKDRIHILCLGTSLGKGDFLQNIAANGHFRPVPEQGFTNIEKGHEFFYSDITEEGLKPFVEALTFRVKHEKPELALKAFEGCDLWSLCCEKDNVIPIDLQMRTAEEHKMRVVRIDTGHCPFVSKPEQFVAVVDRILRPIRV